MAYDPKAPKKLTIYVASGYPSWQEKYIELVREEFERTGLSNDKELVGKVSKMGETKKAMPFVQGLKRRLVQGGEKPTAVFERKLAFDEPAVLKEMVQGLKKVTGCTEIDVVLVDEGGKTGKAVAGKEVEGELPQVAVQAVPGVPSFSFENIKS